MGLEHGAYCLGCCWLLFAVQFALGVMNFAVMALLTVVIFAEKVLPAGRAISAVVAVALIGYGAVMLFTPEAMLRLV